MALPHRAQRITRDLDAWAQKHDAVLTAVWERFAAECEWPEARALARDMFSEGSRMDVTTIARQMPPPLGRFDPIEGQIVLTVRGLAYVESAAHLLNRYLALVQEAVVRYGSRGSAPEIKTRDIQQIYGLTETRKLERLALVEGWALRPAGGQVGDLTLAIDEHIVVKVPFTKDGVKRPPGGRTG